MDPLSHFLADPRLLDVPPTESPFADRLLDLAIDAEVHRVARSLHDDGFAIIDPDIPDSILDGVIDDLVDSYKTNDDSPYYSDWQRVQEAWATSENVRRIATWPRVIEILEAAYARGTIPFQTLNFRVGTEQKTHSDVIHFHSFPQRFMCGVWVALEDVDSENGPVHYYPGSHKLPIYDLSSLGIVANEQSVPLENYWKYEAFVEALMEHHGFTRVDAELKKGQALIWSANLFHGGSAILDSARTRHSQVTHHYFEDCIYYTPIMSDLALGHIQTKKVLNLRTNEHATQSYCGRRILNPGEWPPELGDPIDPTL